MAESTRGAGRPPTPATSIKRETDTIYRMLAVIAGKRGISADADVTKLIDAVAQNAKTVVPTLISVESAELANLDELFPAPAA